MIRWAIIYNPTAGRHRERTLEGIERALRERGISTIAIPTNHPGHASEIAHTVHGVERVAVYGGDGTLNEAANGLAGRDIPLAFLPGGTANVMAHELGLPRDPLRALPLLLPGETRVIRPGRVDSRLFLLMAGFGFDAAAVHGVSPGLKACAGKGAYVWSALRVLFSRQPTLRIVTEGSPERRGVWAVVARAGRYGGRYRIHPRAGLTQTSLGLTVVGAPGLVPFLVANLGLGLSLAAPRIWLEDRTRLRVESAAPVPVQVDGDYCGSGTAFRVDLSETTVPLCFPGRLPSPEGSAPLP